MPIEMKKKISNTKKLAPTKLKLNRIFIKCPICKDEFETVPDAVSRKLNKKSCGDSMCRNKLQSIKISGKNNGMYGKTHTPDTVKKIMSYRKMNKFEEDVANLLTKNGYKYTFQFFIVKNKVCKSYDFKIKGKPIIIEADGDFWHGNPATKQHWKNIKSVQKNDKIKNSIAIGKGYKIIRIWQKDFKKNPISLLDKIKEI